MGVKATCPNCKRTNWAEDAARNTERPCAFCGKPFVFSDDSGRGGGPVAALLGVLVIAGLISVGVLPKSCGKVLPFVGKNYRQYCDECGGDGKVSGSCPACLGRGYYGGVRCRGCGGSGSVERTCGFCAGSGKKPSP